MVKVDNLDSRHFMYLYGSSVYAQRLPLLQEPAGKPFNSTHVLRYGNLNLSRLASGDLDQVNTQIKFGTKIRFMNID